MKRTSFNFPLNFYIFIMTVLRVLSPFHYTQVTTDKKIWKNWKCTIQNPTLSLCSMLHFHATICYNVTFSTLCTFSSQSGITQCTHFIPIKFKTYKSCEQLSFYHYKSTNTYIVRDSIPITKTYLHHKKPYLKIIGYKIYTVVTLLRKDFNST